MKPASLVGRLALLQLLAAGVLLASFAVSTAVLTRRTLEAQEVSALSLTAADVASALRREWGEERDLRRAAGAVLQENAPSGFTVEILDGDGRPVARAPADPPPRADADVRSVRRRVPEGAWVVVSVSTQPRRAAVRALVLTLLLVGLPLFAVTAVLSRVVAARLLRPLRRMASQSRQASKGGVVPPLGHADDPLELRQLSQAFNALLERLERTLEGERRFTQDAAHELRTPLTVVSGEIEYASQRLAPDDPARRGLRHAAQQAQAMSELVDALLFLRRAEADSFTGNEEDAPVNLADLLRETTDDLLEQSPERRNDVTLEAEDEVLVAGNGALLVAAIRNLVSNALKFTSAGIPVRLTAGVHAGLAWAVVEDGGKGVPPGERERVFDPYYRDAEARATRSGFGLGLALVRRIVRAHGGDVVLRSSTLGGACFELTLATWGSRRRTR